LPLLCEQNRVNLSKSHQMVGASNLGSSGGSVGGGYFPPGASETDGETYDDVTDDFGEFDEWDYSEMLSNVCVCRESSRITRRENVHCTCATRVNIARLIHATL
jgi:hypothetical protein